MSIRHRVSLLALALGAAVGIKGPNIDLEPAPKPNPKKPELLSPLKRQMAMKKKAKRGW